MWSTTPSQCGALRALLRSRRSDVVANTPLRALGELGLAESSSYALVRRFAAGFACLRAFGG